MNKGLAAGLAIGALSMPASVWAAGFDVEQATRTYLNLVHGAARARSDAYYEGGYWLILWNAIVGVLVYLLILASGLSARMRDLATAKAGRSTVSVMLYGLMFTLAATLLFLPWTIYTGFVRETQYGLMNQAFGRWMIDQAKALALSLIVSPLAFAAIFGIIRSSPRLWWAWGAAITWLFLVVADVLAPVVVFPLFANFSELPKSALRERIVAMATANRIPAEHVYVADVSQHTKRVAAAVAGLGPSAQITLTDNLLNRAGPDEVVAVVGHEMGHYVLNHGWWRVTLVGMLGAAMFFVVARTAPSLIRRNPVWGVTGVEDVAAVPALFLIYTVLMLFSTPVLYTIVRSQEAEADAFGLDAARLPDAWALVAVRLSEYRKLQPSPLEEILFFDHPSGERRIRQAMRWKKQHDPQVYTAHARVTLVAGFDQTSIEHSFLIDRLGRPFGSKQN